MTLQRETPASSTHAVRALLLPDPPSIDAGEITDKGYINQRAVLTRRKDSVDALYTPGHVAPVPLPTRFDKTTRECSNQDSAHESEA